MNWTCLAKEACMGQQEDEGATPFETPTPTGRAGGASGSRSAAILQTLIPTESRMSKIKLNDAQLVILSTAAKAERTIGRDDLARLKAQSAARTRAVNGLLKRGLIEDVPVKPQASPWRKNKMGEALGLAITAAGLRAIGIEPATTTIKAKKKTKQSRLIELLEGRGSTTTELGETLGWLPHTVRAALTRLRQQGFQIERVCQDGVSRYHIVEDRKVA